MQYKQEDFLHLKFPVFGKTDILKEFPRLAQFPEFKLVSPNFDLDIVIKYVAFCYDIKSPFVKEYATDIVSRKNLSAKYAGFPKVPGSHDRWMEAYQEIIEGRNSVVNKMIVRYVRLLRNLQYTRLVTLLENYHTVSHRLIMNSGMDDDDTALATMKKKGELQKQFGNLNKEIDGLASELFYGEGGLVEGVEDVIEDEVPLGFPEMVAQKGNLNDLRT